MPLPHLSTCNSSATCDWPVSTRVVLEKLGANHTPHKTTQYTIHLSKTGQYVIHTPIYHRAHPPQRHQGFQVPAAEHGSSKPACQHRPSLIESLCVKLSDYHERYNDCIIPQKCPQLKLLTDHWSTWPTYDRPVSTRGIAKNNIMPHLLRTIQQWPHKVDTQSWLSSWGVQTAAAVKVAPKPSGHASTSCFPWSWLQGRQWHWSSYRWY